jgi:hypothetical protein
LPFGVGAQDRHRGGIEGHQSLAVGLRRGGLGLPADLDDLFGDRHDRRVEIQFGPMQTKAFPAAGTAEGIL